MIGTRPCRLVPCTECYRHVRTNSTVCPFCGAAVESVSLPVLPRAPAGLKRATLLALTASATAMACEGVSTPVYGATVSPGSEPTPVATVAPATPRPGVEPAQAPPAIPNGVAQTPEAARPPVPTDEALEGPVLPGNPTQPPEAKLPELGPDASADAARLAEAGAPAYDAGGPQRARDGGQGTVSPEASVTPDDTTEDDPADGSVADSGM